MRVGERGARLFTFRFLFCRPNLQDFLPFLRDGPPNLQHDAIHVNINHAMVFSTESKVAHSP